MEDLATGPSSAQDASFLSPESFPALDEYSTNPRFIELQEELRGVLFARASGHDSSIRSTAGPEVVDADEERSTRKPGFDFSRVGIPKIQLVRYLQNWIVECAPYLDKFDHARHFAIRVPAIAEGSPALFYAVLAFSARQMERKTGSDKTNHDSLELYQESIRLLAPGMQAKDSNMLVTACILAVMELMSGSPRNWRRHIEGCATLFDLFQVNGFSGGVLQAVFWCYARMEVCGAIISGGTESTVLSLRNWVPPVPERVSTNQEADDFVRDAFYQSSIQNPDMHANWVVYLCAKACDLLYRYTRVQELNEPDKQDKRSFPDQWQSLWSELSYWFKTRPKAFLPTLVAEDSGSEIFPTILFAEFPAISSNQVYHATCIIMLDMHPRNEKSFLSSEGSAVWHARRVCGISLTNPHRASLINAIQPLYLAGRLLTHPAEHMQVGKLFKIIEETTGWGALWRLRDLEVVWGYKPGEILSVIS